MRANDVNANLVKAYLELLGNLSTDVKLEIISKLSSSMKSTASHSKKSILGLYGSIESDLSADEMVEMIRNARLFNRQIEPL